MSQRCGFKRRTTGIGAPWPVSHVLTRVGLPRRQQPVDGYGGDRSSCTLTEGTKYALVESCHLVGSDGTRLELRRVTIVEFKDWAEIVSLTRAIRQYRSELKRNKAGVGGLHGQTR